LQKSTEFPHFVFHLSKRLFSETQIKQLTSPLNLNILSAEYIGDATSFIQKKQKKRERKAEAKCISCAQYTTGFSVCRACSLDMVV
jgi:hypothetical protein